MGDEQYYLIVEEELKDEKVDKALWAKASVLGKGDDLQARVQYIQLRVDALKHEAAEKYKAKKIVQAKAQTKKYSIIAGKIMGGIAVVVLLGFAYVRYQDYMNEPIDYMAMECYTDDQRYTYVIFGGQRKDTSLGIYGATSAKIALFNDIDNWFFLRSRLSEYNWNIRSWERAAVSKDGFEYFGRPDHEELDEMFPQVRNKKVIDEMKIGINPQPSSPERNIVQHYLLSALEGEEYYMTYYRYKGDDYITSKKRISSFDVSTNSYQYLCKENSLAEIERKREEES